MKEKQIITYRKEGKEITKIMNPFNKYRIVTTIFQNPFQITLRDDLYKEDDYYEIKEDIEFLYLKNVTFYQNVRFICPKDTIFILENCNFKGNMIKFYGGNIQLINPNLPTEYYSNRIYGTNLEDISIEIQNSNKYLNVSLESKKSYVNIPDEISHLHVNGKEVTLQNISQLKVMNINSSYTKIIDSNIQLPQSKNREEDLTKLANTCNIYTSTIEIENSTIYSYAPLTIRCDKISIDEKSTLSSNYDITVGENIYKKQKFSNIPQTITKQNLLNQTEEDKVNRKFISMLKTIKQQAEIEIKQETDLFENKKNPKIKSKRKKRVLGMYESRKIGTYNSFTK